MVQVVAQRRQQSNDTSRRISSLDPYTPTTDNTVTTEAGSTPFFPLDPRLVSSLVLITDVGRRSAVLQVPRPATTTIMATPSVAPLPSAVLSISVVAERNSQTILVSTVDVPGVRAA